MPMRALLLLPVLLSVTTGAANAACSEASASAKAQEFAALSKQKMTSRPDEMGDLAAEFGDAMAETAGRVTEQTCSRLDSLLRRAKAL